MFRKQLLGLNSVERNQYKTFQLYDQNNSKTNYGEIRQQIVKFFLFLRDGFKRYILYLINFFLILIIYYL